MLPAIRAKNLLAAIFALFLLSGCVAQLVPDYDQSLVDGLNTANEETLTLFASVETGSEETEFAGYEDDYAGLIGKFEALRQRARARYVPPLGERISQMQIAPEICNSEDDPQACLNVTPTVLGQVLSTLRRMRDQHEANGLVSAAVVDFRGAYDTQIDQALTIENALKR